MAELTKAALRAENERLTIALTLANDKAVRERVEAQTAIRERDALGKVNDDLRERALSDGRENARLVGMLDMLRELGMIPKPEPEPMTQQPEYSDGLRRWRSY